MEQHQLNSITTGIRHEIEKVALPEDSATRYDSGLVHVFSTPALVALMESAAYRCVAPYLPEGFSTVGYEIRIKHLKATPIGMKVRCIATLMEKEEKKLTFSVKAWDEIGIIGEGVHVRYIINQQKFMDKLNS